MRKLLLITTLLLLAGGCANIDKPYPERKYFQFEVNYTGQPQIPTRGAILGVHRFSVSPGSQGIEFIYRTGEFNYHADFYNQFFRPPGPLITEAVTNWFAGSGVFQEVLGQLSQSIPNYVIEGNVVKLYGDFRDGVTTTAVLEIQLFFLKATDDDDSPIIITSGTYNADIPISSNDPKVLMAGWNRGLMQILADFQKDIQENLARSMQTSFSQNPSGS